MLKIAKLSFNSRLNVRRCSHIGVYYRTTVLSACPGAFRRWRALLCRQLRGSSTNSAGRRALWEQMRRDTAVQLQNLTLDNNNNNNRKCSSGCGSGTGSGSGSSAAGSSSSSRVNVAPVTRGTTTAHHTLRQLIPTTTAKWWSEEGSRKQCPNSGLQKGTAARKRPADSQTPYSCCCHPRDLLGLGATLVCSPAVSSFTIWGL